MNVLNKIYDIKLFSIYQFFLTIVIFFTDNVCLILNLLHGIVHYCESYSVSAFTKKTLEYMNEYLDLVRFDDGYESYQPIFLLREDLSDAKKEDVSLLIVKIILFVIIFSLH